jgi:hypothetical protein
MLKFLKTEREEELEMIAQKSAEIGKAVAVLMELSADERTRMLAEAREKAWRDEMDRLDGARTEEVLDTLRFLMEDGASEESLRKYAQRKGIGDADYRRIADETADREG